VAPGPADGQHTLQHEEMLDDLMRMAGSVFADRLMHKAQRELSWLQGAGVVGLGRTAGPDVAHLRPRQVRKAAASGKRIPTEALVGVTPDEGPHLALQVEPIGLR